MISKFLHVLHKFPNLTYLLNFTCIRKYTYEGYCCGSKGSCARTKHTLAFRFSLVSRGWHWLVYAYVCVCVCCATRVVHTCMHAGKSKKKTGYTHICLLKRDWIQAAVLRERRSCEYMWKAAPPPATQLRLNIDEIRKKSFKFNNITALRFM